MSSDYNHEEIEKKWQKIWEEKQVFKASDSYEKPKYYVLVEFPYPSGQGLHVGHPRSYTALDVVARKKRMQGFNVLYPMGWDAFGLPAENFAIKNNIHPAIVTKKNIEHFKAQLKSLGLSFDWSREINTTDPSYYKWTQWIFLKLFEKGLAYKSEAAVNWCTSCRCVLANEEVVNGKCERCSSEVVQKVKSQWMLRITKYADRLINDLSLVDYPEEVKAQQINWIGKSEGAEINFDTTLSSSITVFTTRPDTIFGVTYLVVSPEHPILDEWSNRITNLDEVKKYQQEASKKSDLERTADISKNKTGVKLEGVYAINPLNSKEIPIFISDYVLMNYGTGAIMAVPAHDKRDKEFAIKYNLPQIDVIDENGILINSDFLNGMTSDEAKKEVINWVKSHSKGNSKINYKLRDWVFSRQRYWGEPIPIVHCEKCGYVPLKESDLPLVLPEIEKFEPSLDGESPLINAKDWVNTSCPRCGKPAKRETDTMPQWAGSSWYFLRYTDVCNDKEFASKEAMKYWLPVDWYNGGMEHTTLHLLYSRFWYKFLFDLDLVPTPEPYFKRTSHGLILGENGEKMSKSRGNVVNPDEIVKTYGADAMRVYEMFISDYTKPAPWSTAGLKGVKRFLERYWNLKNLLDKTATPESQKLENSFHKAIKKVNTDIENLKFNTAIATLMSLINEIYEAKHISLEQLKVFTILLSPFAPHITEEIYSICNLGEGLLCMQAWPTYDESKCRDDEIEIALQVNGKFKGKVLCPRNTSKEEVFDKAMLIQNFSKYVLDKDIKKIIYVQDRILNVVV